MTPPNDLGTVLGRMFQAHPWHGVPAQPAANVFHAFIEIVPTDTVKYELDKPSGHLRIDRPQRFSSLCPTLYGFIPQTHCAEAVAARCSERTGLPAMQGDGDPLDICVLTEKTMAHGNFLARVHPIGGLRLIDGNQADDKIVAVLESDVAYGHFHELTACPPGLVERLKHYFLSYKQRPGEASHRVQVAEVYDRTEALEVIRRSTIDYAAHFGDPADGLAELRKLLR